MGNGGRKPCRRPPGWHRVFDEESQAINDILLDGWSLPGLIRGLFQVAVQFENCQAIFGLADEGSAIELLDVVAPETDRFRDGVGAVRAELLHLLRGKSQVVISSALRMRGYDDETLDSLRRAIEDTLGGQPRTRLAGNRGHAWRDAGGLRFVPRRRLSGCCRQDQAGRALPAYADFVFNLDALMFEAGDLASARRWWTWYPELDLSNDISIFGRWYWRRPGHSESRAPWPRDPGQCGWRMNIIM